MIGAAPAGHPFAGAVGPGQAVRIFTGGFVPEGADAILLQEDAEAERRRRAGEARRCSRAAGSAAAASTSPRARRCCRPGAG